MLTLGQPVLTAPNDLLLPLLTSVSREELLLDAKAMENSDIIRYSHSAAPTMTKSRSICSQSIFVLKIDTMQQMGHGLAGARMSPLLAEQDVPANRFSHKM